jgi:hypothetical protein
MSKIEMTVIPPEAAKYMVEGVTFEDVENAQIHRELLQSVNAFTEAANRMTNAIAAKTRTADGEIFWPNGRAYWFLSDEDWPTAIQVRFLPGRFSVRMNSDQEVELVAAHPQLIGEMLSLKVEQLYSTQASAITAMAAKRQADIAWRQAHINQP